MKSFQWTKHFITGLTSVDDQHHHLVDIINQFGRLLTNQDIRIQDVDRLYSQLADYSVYHFQEEEKLMKETMVDTRHVKQHIRAHSLFLEDVATIYEEIYPDKLDQASLFLKFLMHWLAHHILGKDQDMAKQIEAIQSGLTPRQAYDQLEQQRDSATAPLLDALNGLFEQVSKRNKELKQLNESLEEKVALRTRELTEANLILEGLSLTDALTGLPNRRHAMRLLARLWDEAVLNDSPLVCMMIDADYFKEVNDLYGHATGDAVLTELAKKLQHSLRNDDTVCRLGGDEFFIICPNTDDKGGLHIAESTLKTVTELMVPTGGKPWHGSISVGIASRLPEMNSYEELIIAADKGLYIAKKAGRNCIRTAV